MTRKNDYPWSPSDVVVNLLAIPEFWRPRSLLPTVHGSIFIMHGGTLHLGVKEATKTLDKRWYVETHSRITNRFEIEGAFASS